MNECQCRLRRRILFISDDEYQYSLQTKQYDETKVVVEQK
jgi:hypothetical protein